MSDCAKYNFGNRISKGPGNTLSVGIRLEIRQIGGYNSSDCQAPISGKFHKRRELALK